MRRQTNLKYILAVTMIAAITIGTCSILYAQSRVATTQQQQYYQPKPQYYQQQPQQAQQQPKKKQSFFNKLFGEAEEEKEVPVPPANVPPPSGYTGGPVVGAPQTGQQVSPPRVSPPKPGQLPQSSNIVAQPRLVENRASFSTASTTSESSSASDGSIYSRLKGYQKDIKAIDTLAPPDGDEEMVSSLPTPPNAILAERRAIDETDTESRRNTSTTRRSMRSGSLNDSSRAMQKLDTDEMGFDEEPVAVATVDMERVTKPRGLPVLEPIDSEELQPSSRRTLQTPPALKDTASKRNPPMENRDEPARIARRDPPNIQQSAMVPLHAMEIQSLGPKNVFVGQEATYEFRITNNSGAVADEVVVNIEIPTWVEIVQPTEQTLGMTSWNAINVEMNVFKWNVGRLNARQQASLTLHIIPREARPINLVPRYDFRQTSSEVAIEVQQPKLEMSLEGPSEALWGAEENYTLKIRNTGNGDAHNVKLVFMASGSEPQETVLDELPVGGEHLINIGLAPKLSGDLQIHVQASGPYGLSAETRKHVTIHRAEIETLVEGPPFQFVGNTMEYVVVAVNRGTAPAQNVEIIVPMPNGIKYVSHSDNGDFLESQNELVWHVRSIPPGQEYSCSVICEAKREGEFQLNAKVIADTGIQSIGSMICVVEAIADVNFKIEPPGNPWEVGKDGEYTVIVTNQGTKSAQGIKLAAYFTEGLTATHVSGIQAQISGGTVLFDTIHVLSPGQSIPCKIRTNAATDGNHKIRVTMECQSTNTNKSAEETTYYFQRRGLRKNSTQTVPMHSGLDYDFASPAPLPAMSLPAASLPAASLPAASLPAASLPAGSLSSAPVPISNAAPLPGGSNVMLPPATAHQLPMSQPSLTQTTIAPQNSVNGLSIAEPAKTRLPVQGTGSRLPMPPPTN